MLYVRLNVNGRKGLAREKARGMLSALKQKVWASGEVTLSKPNTKGVYYAIFDRESMATAFVACLEALGVAFNVTDEAPGKVRPVERPAPSTVTRTTIGVGAVPGSVQFTRVTITAIVK